MVRNEQPALALIVADGDVPPREQLAIELQTPAADTLVICADGGLRRADLLGLRPALVIGDGDSLDRASLAALEERGVELQLHPTDKDESDTELALLEAIRRGATRIVVLGALGGLRFDHALANVLLLARDELAGRDVALVDGTTTVRLVEGPGSIALRGAPGDLVSLLPLSETVSGARTEGLRYRLDGETLRQGPARGLSNELLGHEGIVEIASGRLVVVHTNREPAA